MAIITCPECGKEISDVSKKCIYCGYPIKQFRSKFSAKKMVIGVFSILFLIVGMEILFLLIRLDPTEKAYVNEVEDAISDIGEVQINSGLRITEAEQLYNSISKKCQMHVENYNDLKKARKEYNILKAEEIENRIANIGDITIDNQEIVDEVKKEYDLLTTEQKKLVNNSKDLFSAVEVLDDLRVEYVHSKIGIIGDVSLDSKEQIEDARNSYDKLSEECKIKITEYDTLLDAEKKYDKLVLDQCISLISELENFKGLDSKEDIDKAREIYDSLSNAEKEKVYNYDILVSATEEYERLLQEEEKRKKILKEGDEFTTSEWKIEYNKANISSKIFPDNTSGYYSYYYATEDETFIDLVFNVKNISNDIIGLDSLVGDCEVEYDGSIYNKSHALITSRGSELDKVYPWDGLDALQSTTLHVVINMPRELESNSSIVTVIINIAGEERIICVR